MEPKGIASKDITESGTMEVDESTLDYFPVY